MRGIYTSAVLDYFLEKDIKFDYTIGVSAGAINAASFLSKQKERTKNVLIKYTNDSRYMGMGNLIREGNFFGTDFAYNQIPNKLIPFVVSYNPMGALPVIGIVTGSPAFCGLGSALVK